MANGDIGFWRIREEDLPLLRNWRNSPAVAQYMYTDVYITEQMQRGWYEKIRIDPSVSYWMTALNDVPVGLAYLFEINRQNKSATSGLYLADPVTRGQGIGQYVEYCMLEFAFNYWKLDVVSCEVLESNPSSIAMHESAGFKRVGRLPGRAVKSGIPVDAITYALTREQWTSGEEELVKARIRAKGREPVGLLTDLENAQAQSCSPP